MNPQGAAGHPADACDLFLVSVASGGFVRWILMGFRRMLQDVLILASFGVGCLYYLHAF